MPSKVGDKVILEQMKKQPIDLEKWGAELDALGAKDFLPEGIPDEPPAEPDPRVFFDDFDASAVSMPSTPDRGFRSSGPWILSGLRLTAHPGMTISLDTPSKRGN